MSEVYRSPLIPEAPDAAGIVVIHCSDPRYQPHFQDFVRNGLKIDRYSLLAIPGGVQTLTLVDLLPKFAWSGWRWLKFLKNLTRPERAILITHDDCRWYLENHFAEPARARERQVADLQRVAAALVERFGPIRIELYYAALSRDGATFDRLAVQSGATV